MTMMMRTNKEGNNNKKIEIMNGKNKNKTRRKGKGEILTKQIKTKRKEGTDKETRKEGENRYRKETQKK